MEIYKPSIFIPKQFTYNTVARQVHMAPKEIGSCSRVILPLANQTDKYPYSPYTDGLGQTVTTGYSTYRSEAAVGVTDEMQGDFAILTALIRVQKDVAAGTITAKISHTGTGSFFLMGREQVLYLTSPSISVGSQWQTVITLPLFIAYQAAGAGASYDLAFRSSNSGWSCGAGDVVLGLNYLSKGVEL